MFLKYYLKIKVFINKALFINEYITKRYAQKSLISETILKRGDVNEQKRHKSR